MTEATYEFQHIFFQHLKPICNVNNLPEWITRKSQKWFLEDYVLKLAVGEKIESDFHIITRLS